jgi:membrane protein DedA with SNARE-associated domain
MAGVASMPRARFVAAVTAGRGLRYVGEAVLALLYGRQALSYIHDNGRQISLVLGIAIVVGAAGYYAYRKLGDKRKRKVT